MTHAAGLHLSASHVLLFASLAALGAQMLYLHLQGTSKDYPQTKEEMRKHIVWRSFYINPDDPRAWLPKIWGPGYTVNFRTKTNAVIFSLIILTTLLSAFWMTGAALLF